MEDNLIFFFFSYDILYLVMSRESLRISKLFRLLAAERSYQPASFFSEKLQVSTKTLLADVTTLNSKLKPYGMQIIKSPRKGLLLEAEERQIAAYQENEKDSSPEEMYLPENRRRKIAGMLLLKNENPTFEQLENLFYTNVNSIRADIDAVRKQIQRQNVQIVYENNRIYARGTEADIQNAFKKYELDIKQSNSRCDDEFFDDMSAIFDRRIVVFTRNLLNEFKGRVRRTLSDHYLIGLFYSISILLTRTALGFHIQEGKRFVFQNIDGMGPYIIAVDIANRASAETGTILYDQDIEFLSESLFAYGIEPSNLALPQNSIYVTTCDDIIQRMSGILKTDLTDDTVLRDSLLYHIIPMIYRLKNGFVIHNPLLASIKKQYLVMFTLTWHACFPLENEFNILLTDDEISFLTIHFQVAYAKKVKPKNILIVCPEGLATSELLFSRLKSVLPAGDHLETASVEQIYTNDLSDISFIISLVPLKNIDKKVIYVSSILTNEQINEIVSYSSAVNEDVNALKVHDSVSMEEFTGVLDENFLFWNRSFSGREEVLDFLIGKYEQADIVTEDFRKSVYDRETLGTTYVGDKVAIPHASPRTVRKTMISIMTLDKPVRWEEGDADIIIMIAVAEQDTGRMRELFARLFSLIDSANGTAKLRKVRSVGELVKMLNEEK